MAGRGRGQSVQRGRGRGGVVVGDACRRSAEDFRPYDGTNFESFEHGRPAPRVSYGDDQERRVAGRNRGGSVLASAAAAGWEDSPASHVSDLGNTRLSGLGRGVEDLGRSRGHGRGRGVGFVCPTEREKLCS
jgi:hypothetical protein